MLTQVFSIVAYELFMKYPLESHKLATLQIHRTNLFIICESEFLLETVMFNALIN